MISRWYFPSYTGDFRILSIEDSSYRDLVDGSCCALEVVDPAIHEIDTIDRFLARCYEQRWTPSKKLSLSEVAGKKRQEILLATTVAEAGQALYQLVRPADRTITAIKSEDGSLVVSETVDLKKAVEPDAVVDKPKKKKAVSVSRPTPSCPQCVPDARSRASEVLLSFLSPADRRLWEAERCVVARGGLTGHRYVLAHRHSDLAVRFGRICYDLNDDVVLHFHDNSVPPEEEVLAAKLILEHREPWLRNEATFFGVGQRFKNPFGDFLDGTFDAGITQAIGVVMREVSKVGGSRLR